jgi:hypothetical protein
LTLDEKLELLDKLKTEIIDLRERIQNLEGEIAVEMCPIKIGDTITIDDHGKTYDGVVEEIGTLYSPYDAINPTIGNRPTWRVGGARVNKGSGEPGKWGFNFTGNRASLENGVWVLKGGSIEDVLNI